MELRADAFVPAIGQHAGTIAEEHVLARRAVARQQGVAGAGFPSRGGGKAEAEAGARLALAQLAKQLHAEVAVRHKFGGETALGEHQRTGRLQALEAHRALLPADADDCGRIEPHIDPGVKQAGRIAGKFGRDAVRQQWAEAAFEGGSDAAEQQASRAASLPAAATAGAKLPPKATARARTSGWVLIFIKTPDSSGQDGVDAPLAVWSEAGGWT